MKMGVVAFRIEAMPLVMCVSPQAISTKGIALFSRPRSRKRFHRPPPSDSGVPRTASHRFSAMAANPTRPNTTVTGGRTATNTL